MPIQIIPSHRLSCLSLGDVSQFTTWFVLSMFHLCLTFSSNCAKAFSSFSNMSLSIYLYLNHLIKWVSHFLRCTCVAKCTQQWCCAKHLCVHSLENHFPCGIVDALHSFTFKSLCQQIENVFPKDQVWTFMDVVIFTQRDFLLLSISIWTKL